MLKISLSPQAPVRETMGLSFGACFIFPTIAHPAGPNREQDKGFHLTSARGRNTRKMVVVGRYRSVLGSVV